MQAIFHRHGHTAYHFVLDNGYTASVIPGSLTSDCAAWPTGTTSDIANLIHQGECFDNEVVAFMYRIAALPKFGSGAEGQIKKDRALLEGIAGLFGDDAPLPLDDARIAVLHDKIVAVIEGYSK